MDILVTEAIDWLEMCEPKPTQMRIAGKTGASTEDGRPFVKFVFKDTNKDRAVLKMKVFLSGYFFEKDTVVWRVQPVLESLYDPEVNEVEYRVSTRVVAWKE